MTKYIHYRLLEPHNSYENYVPFFKFYSTILAFYGLRLAIKTDTNDIENCRKSEIFYSLSALTRIKRLSTENRNWFRENPFLCVLQHFKVFHHFYDQ